MASDGLMVRRRRIRVSSSSDSPPAQDTRTELGPGQSRWLLEHSA